ncbi:MAG: hypothetical protein WDN23_07245 [Edaphobacter sp.]
MRRLLTTGLLLSATTVFAQTPTPTVPETPAQLPTATELPDAPSSVKASQESVVVAAQDSLRSTSGHHTCNVFSAMKTVYYDPNRYDQVPKPCTELIYPYQRFLSSNVVIPMTWQQKGYLAIHNLTDPANIGTILGISAISVAVDPDSAYGPGLKGFGKTVGVSLLQDATAQFFGVFAIPVVARQDPRYFRMPHASIPRRIVYSVTRSFVSRHDDGRPMPNYSVLLTYPIDAEIDNLYVPGIHPDGGSTASRILTGYALDPVNNLLTEFLPDVASRVHVRVIFVQRILNNIASTNGGVGLP